MSRSTRMARALAGALLVLLAACPPGAASAETGPWSPPIPLSGWGNRVWAWFPAIAADIYGNVHVVWAGGGEGLADDALKPPPDRLSDDAAWLTYTRWDGRQWSPPNEIAATVPSGNALRSALVADQAGRLHLFYRGLDLSAPAARSAETEALRHSVADGLQAERATAWSPGLPLSRRVPAYFPDIVVDHRGTLHAVWTEYDGVFGYGVFYRRSKDGGVTWSPSYALEGVRPAHRWRLQVAVGPDDVLHVVWEIVDSTEATRTASATLGFVYARSGDGGQSWTQKPFLPAQVRGRYERSFEGTGWRQQPAIGVDRRGQVLVVWREYGTNLIYWQRSVDGQSWSAPEPLPGIARGIARPFDRYDLATDGDGHVHLVAAAYPVGVASLALIHSEWTGDRWLEPRVVETGGAPRVPEWPRIAVANGNELHVVWFAGDSEQAGRVPVGLWYSTARSSASFIPPAARLLAPARATTGQSSGASSEDSHQPAEPALPPPPPVGEPSRSLESSQSTTIRALVASASAIVLLLVATRGFRRVRAMH